jgi:hypothetical protein
MSISREQLLAPASPVIEEVQVPELGGSVFVRVMSGFERDAYEASLLAARKEGKEFENVRARLVVRTVCDKDGNLLLTPADADTLGKQNWKALGRIVEAAQRLNRLTLRDLEELKGNSAPSLGDEQS